MDDNREIIECIKIRDLKANLINNSVYLLIKTNKRKFELTVNAKTHKGMMYDLVFRGDTFLTDFIKSALYDFIIDNNIMTFYTSIGKFSIKLTKIEQSIPTIPRFKITESGKEIWNIEIGE